MSFFFLHGNHLKSLQGCIECFFDHCFHMIDNGWTITEMNLSTKTEMIKFDSNGSITLNK